MGRTNMSRTSKKLCALLVPLALVAAACGGDDDDAPAAEPAEEPAEEPAADIMRARLRAYHPSRDDMDRIVAVADALEKQGIELVIVHLPTPPRMVTAIPNRSVGYLQTVAAVDLVAQASGARLLDMSLGWGHESFVDYTHLAEDGATDFTNQFIAALQSDRDDRGTSPIPLGDAPDEVVDEDCVPETVIDDYGFEVEIVSCATAPWAPPSLISLSSGVVADALAERDRACAAGESPTDALTGLAAAIDTETARIADANKNVQGLL